MATRVDTLTPEQTAQLQPWADRWIGIGLSTDPADFDAFEGHARRAYEAAGLEWPGIVIRVSSPLAAAYAVPLTALVLDGLRRGGQVRGQVRDQVGDQVLGQVRDQVRDQVGDQVLGQVERWILDRWHWDSGWWITWLAWATYFRDACHLDMPGALWDRVGPLEHAAQAAWAWWPQEDYVVVCDRPLVVHRQATGETGWGSHRLHCTDGPAVAFRDGWAVWAIEGVRVTEQIVMRPETITVARTPQVHGVDRTHGAVTEFGLGFATSGTPTSYRPGSNGFGHGGAYGSLGHADPDARLGFGFVFNQLGEPQGDGRAARLLNAALDAI